MDGRAVSTDEIHPDLLRMLETEREAREQGYTDGGVNHYVQPIIGMLRLGLRDGNITDDDLQYAVDRLEKACLAERAWLQHGGISDE